MSELDQSFALSEIEAGHGADISSDYIMETSIDMDLNATNTSMCTIDLQQDYQCPESDIIHDTYIPTTQQSRVRGTCILNLIPTFPSSVTLIFVVHTHI